MIVYNEIVALTAGAGLLGFAWFLKQLIRKDPIESEGWAGFFGVTGLILLVTGLHTTMTWPFGAEGFEYANIAFGQPAAAFGQPAAAFGALLLLATVYLWRHRAAALRRDELLHAHRHVLQQRARHDAHVVTCHP